MNITDNDDNDNDFKSDTYLVRKIKRNLKESEQHLSKWFDQAHEDFDFFAGNQWSTDDMQTLEEQGRPAIVFNRVVRTINAISGLELQNPQEVSFTPREEGDVTSSELLTGAAKWAIDNCDGDKEVSQAFRDSLICGLGVTETRLDYETSIDGTILIERVDPLQMRYDSSSVKRNLDDAKWVARIKYFSKEEFKEHWPDVEISLFAHGSAASGDDVTSLNDFGEERYLQDTTSGSAFKKDKQIPVIQYQEYRREPFYRVQKPNGEIEIFNQAEFSKAKAIIKQFNLVCVKQMRRVYEQVFLYGDTVLEKGPCPVNGFTFRFITGAQDRNNNIWFGIVKVLSDPQRWANKWLSQIMYILNTNAQGGYFYETDAFANPREAAENISAPDKNVELNPGGMGKVQLKEVPRYPDGIDRLLNYATTSINELVGVNLEMLGVANRDQAGILEQERKQAGVTILADFFDALDRYRKEQGRILAEFVIKYIADGRLIKIAGNDMGKYVPLLKENLDFEYDIIIDTSPTSLSQKEKVFSLLVNIMPMLIQGGIPVPPELIDYAPIPSSLAQKWKQMLAKGPSPEELKQKQLSMQLAELEAAKRQAEIESMQYDNAKTQSGVVLDYAKAGKEAAVAQDETAQAMQKASIGKLEQLTKNSNYLNEQARKDAAFANEQQRKDVALALEARRKASIGQLN